MPIPPPARYAPSNLTKKQQQEQLAVCYGVNMSEQLTATEVEKMRHIVAQHDSTSNKTTIHDLNNPPKEPYRFQKFPLTVYDLKASYPSRDEDRPKPNGAGRELVHIPAKLVTKLVHSEADLRESIEDGWSEEAPAFGAEPDNTLSAKYASEAGRVQAKINVAQPDAVSPLDKMGKPELLALAKECGVEVDARWGLDRIRATLKEPESAVA